MSEPTVEIYRTSGTWAKPAGAREIDVILAGADSSGGNPGEVTIHTFAADSLPAAVEISVGKSSPASAPTTTLVAGKDGLAVIITRY